VLAEPDGCDGKPPAVRPGQNAIDPEELAVLVRPVAQGIILGRQLADRAQQRLRTLPAESGLRQELRLVVPRRRRASLSI
jgi:hypothetical protein